MHDKYDQYYKALGLKVSYYRKLKGWTQQNLADEMGVSTSYIGQIEGPNIYKPISLDTLFRIATALGVPPHKFIEFD